MLSGPKCLAWSQTGHHVPRPTKKHFLENVAAFDIEETAQDIVNINMWQLLLSLTGEQITSIVNVIDMNQIHTTDSDTASAQIPRFTI